MKDKLIEIFGLPASSTEEEVLATAKRYYDAHSVKFQADAYERRIRELITETHGAVNRETAIEILQRRDAGAAAQQGT
jgi:hypothetical protein